MFTGQGWLRIISQNWVDEKAEWLVVLFDDLMAGGAGKKRAQPGAFLQQHFFPCWRPRCSYAAAKAIAEAQRCSPEIAEISPFDALAFEVSTMLTMERVSEAAPRTPAAGSESDNVCEGSVLRGSDECLRKGWQRMVNKSHDLSSPFDDAR